MELIKFIEKFLPDYEAKHRTEHINNAVAGLPHKQVEEEFINYYFPEALQNFADRICEKQREQCKDDYECYEPCDYIGQGIFLNSEQPQIDEL